MTCGGVGVTCGVWCLYMRYEYVTICVSTVMFRSVILYGFMFRTTFVALSEGEAVERTSTVTSATRRAAAAGAVELSKPGSELYFSSGRMSQWHDAAPQQAQGFHSSACFRPD